MLNGVFSFTVASKKNKKKRGNANERAHSWGRGWRNGRRKKPLRTFVFIECLKWRKIRCLFPVANVVFFLYSPSSLHHTDPPPFCATFHRIVFPPPPIRENRREIISRIFFQVTNLTRFFVCLPFVRVPPFSRPQFLSWQLIDWGSSIIGPMKTTAEKQLSR